MKRIWTGLLLGMVILLTAGQCSSRDTCSPGETMTNPRVAGEFLATAPSPELLLAWDIGTGRGADLPDSYFAEVTLSDRTDSEVAALITGISYSGQRALAVTFSNLTDYLSSHDALQLFLEFPDRRQFIDCTHPGSSDRYFLEVTLGFDAAGNLVDTRFSQSVWQGPI